MGKHAIETRDVVRLLGKLGFSCSAEAAHYVFRREADIPGESPVIIALPVGSRPLQPAVVASVKRQLDEAGLLAREDFARKIEPS